MEITNYLRSFVNVLLAVFLVPSVNADTDYSQADNFQAVPTCNRMDIPGYPSFYMEIFGFFWDTMQCPTDMVFDSFYCECIYSFNVGPTLPFTAAPRAAVAVVDTPPPPQPTPPRTTTTTEASLPFPVIVPRPPPPPATTTTISTTKLETPRPPTTTTTQKPTTKTPKRRGLVKFLFSLDDFVPKQRPPPTTTLSTTTTPSPTTTPSTTTSPVAFIKTSFVEKKEVVKGSGTFSAKKICSGCRFDGGVGYKNHERDCDKYVMCSPSGLRGSLKADIRSCGVGEYWDQALLTCRLSTDVPCSTDKCRSLGNWYTYSYIGDCRAYWRCENGVSIGHCCPKGQGYVNGVGCLRNPSCNTNCGLPTIEIGCIKRPVPGNPRKFRQTIEGHGDIDMDCAAGTVFSPDTCDCQTDKTVSYVTKVCKPELDLSFSPEVKDVSGKNVHVNGINVTYNKGAVCFHSDGAVVVPRFANAEIGNTLDISLRFKSSDDVIGNELQAVVYNGDCGMDPSIVVAIAKDKIVYTLRNKSNRTMSLTVNLPVKVGKWMTGRFSLQNDIMAMTIDGRTEKRLFFGDIDRSRCGLKLGWGKQYESFVGCVDKMSVSFCQHSTT